MGKLSLFAGFFMVLWVSLSSASSGMEITIVPVGDIPSNLIKPLAEELRSRILCEINTSKASVVPEGSYNPKRRQYHAEVVLDAIIKGKRPNAILLGIIEGDLYVEGLNFVFGIADPLRKGALISVTRLRESFYGMPEDDLIFKRRIITEAVHEIGHVAGLKHCQNPRCVMFFSNNLMDTDKKGPDFCQGCRNLFHKAFTGAPIPFLSP